MNGLTARVVGRWKREGDGVLCCLGVAERVFGPVDLAAEPVDFFFRVFRTSEAMCCACSRLMCTASGDTLGARALTGDGCTVMVMPIDSEVVDATLHVSLHAFVCAHAASQAMSLPALLARSLSLTGEKRRTVGCAQMACRTLARDEYAEEVEEKHGGGDSEEGERNPRVSAEMGVETEEEQEDMHEATL